MSRAVIFTCLAIIVLAQCETQQIMSPKGQEGDLFGGVALSGRTLAIGEFTAFGNAGAVFVFELVDGTWVHEDVLVAPEPDADDEFGPVLDIGPGTIIVGASGSSAPEFRSGAAYVYCRALDSRRWVLDAVLTASDGDFGDRFGSDVSINGERALIGAWTDEQGELNEVGSAYVFERMEGRWSEVAKLEDPDPGELHLFGHSVALHGDVALIGASGHDAAGSFSGSVFVFRRNAVDQWEMEAELVPRNLTHHDFLGRSVALDGGLALVGAVEASPNGTQSGSAWIFRDYGGKWVEEAELLPSDGQLFAFFGAGTAVDATTERAIVGARCADGEAGAAYLFEFAGVDWQQVTKLTPTPGVNRGGFGSCVAMDGDLGAIAAAGQSEAPGVVFAYAGISGVDCDKNRQLDGCEIADGSAADVNGDGVLDKCQCLADVDQDGITGVDDLVAVLLAWGSTDPSADVNDDGVVDIEDLTMTLLAWGPCVR